MIAVAATLTEAEWLTTTCGMLDAEGWSWIHYTPTRRAETLYTDGSTTYNRLAKHADVTHERIEMVHATEPAHDLLPAVHRVASLLKRWLAGTLHHGQSTRHLDYYLDEFTFRFNRRTSRSRGLLFYRLLQQAVNTDPHPLNELIATGRDDWS